MYEWIGKITRYPSHLRRYASWLNCLPKPLLYLVCHVIGNMLYWVAGAKLRQTIMTNMSNVLSDLTPLQIKIHCRQYFRNLVITFYEILFESWRLNGKRRNNLESKGEHHLQEVLQLGKGAIVYAPHIGNFFYYYWYLSRQYNCLTVGTAASPELQIIYKQFEQLGCRGLDYDQTPPLEMMRLLRKHLAENGVLFLLGDFWRPQFPLTELFGRLTRGPQGAAALALDQQIPIVPFCGKRTRSFEHQMTFAQPIHLHEKYTRSQRLEATLSLNHYLEQSILTYPEQWFYWFNLHERWEEI